MSKRRRTLLLSLVLVPLVSVGLYYGSVSIFRQRCAWVTCGPLTWSEIQTLGRAAADQRTPDYRIQSVQVWLMEGTPNPALGPLPLTVQMYYADPTPIPGRGEYPTDQLTIDTQARTWSWKRWSVGGPPAPDGQERLARPHRSAGGVRADLGACAAGATAAWEHQCSHGLGRARGAILAVRTHLGYQV